MALLTTDGMSQPDAKLAGFRTFLIADIRGYTTYTREKGDEAAAALAATFAATVREVVTARDGFLLELRGDEALVVFESPRQALRAAVALQDRLKEIGLPRGVGIGLDAGEAIPVEGGYRGGALNLAARLCSQAKAGEVLASEAVIHLAAHIDGVEYIDARTLRLKGFAQPIRAVEVVPADQVRGGLARRVRRVRRGLGAHRRMVLGTALAVAAGSLAIVIATRPMPATVFSDPLASLPAGVVVLNAATGEVIAQIPTSTIKTPDSPFYAGGKFWVLNLDPYSLVEVDAKTGQMGRVIAPALPCCGGQAVDGDTMWVTDFDHPIVAKIHIPSGREVARFDLTDQLGDEASDGFSTVVVADGSLWLAGKNRGVVFRVDPKNGQIQAKVSNVRGSWVLAAGENTLWGASFGGLDRIDTATNTVAHTDLGGAIGLGGAVTTSSGFGWTANESKGLVYKVDPSGRVAATYATGLGAHSVSFSDGVVWVGNQDEGTVSAIDVITATMHTLKFGHPVAAVAAGGGSLAVVLGDGKSYEDRIQALGGKVARLFIEGYQFPSGDPATTWTPAAFMIEQATCAKLVNYSEAGELQAEIATSMPKISSDGRTYTFEVRPGFKFSEPSGESVTAETFRFSIERALSPALEGGDQPAAGHYFVTDIAGEQAFRDGKTDHISGLVANGATLTITLTAPSPDFLARLALPFFCPVPVDTPMLAGAASQRSDTPAGFIEQVPSAGPYYVADHLNGEYVILKRNPSYAGARKAAFDAIALREGVNGGVAISRVLSGDWDGVVGVYDEVFDPAAELATKWGPGSSAAAAGDQRYRAIPDGGIYYLEFNASRPPFSNPQVRQAVSLALNREVMAAGSAGQFGAALPWGRVLGPSMRLAGSGPTSVPAPDLATARRLAAPAGGSVVKLAVTKGCDQCMRGAEYLTTDLAAIGLKVEVAAVEDSAAAIQEPNADYDMKLGASWPDTPDPATFLARLLSEDMPSAWVSASVRDAAAALSSATDRSGAATALADGPLTSEIPMAVFAYTVHGAFFAPSIGCLRFTALGDLDLVALCPKS